MSTSDSICVTCLSNIEEGANLTEVLKNFLCDILHFKHELVKDSAQIICRKCYKTLIDLKCFYTQLRDVEIYFFESKCNVFKKELNGFKENDKDEDDPCFPDMECTVSIDEVKLESILIDEDEECCIVEKDEVSQQPKSSVNGRRFVCLTCSKLFASINDLHSHEKTHLPQIIHKTPPVFLPANSSTKQVLTCTECGQKFNKSLSLERHIRNHKNRKLRPFGCAFCKRRFSTKEQHLNHISEYSKYECKECNKKYCNQPALDIHMKDSHSKIEEAT